MRSRNVIIEKLVFVSFITERYNKEKKIGNLIS